MRNSPFGEWVNVFYDPTETDESTLLRLIKEKDCPRAKRTMGKSDQVLNPIIAAGDPVQLKFDLKESTQLLPKHKLPENWKLIGSTDFQKGENVVTLQTPKKISPGEMSFDMEFTNGEKINAVIDVVKQVGKH